MNDQKHPMSWESGPPETKIESWNFERRTELLNISSAVLQAQVMGSIRHGSSDDSLASLIDPKRAVDLANQLITEAEKIRPKL